MTKACWSVAIAKPCQEIRALSNLTNRGFECFFPRIRIRKIIKPLFPRYLFVNMKQAWSKLLTSPGVSDVVRVGNKPALIRDDVVDAVRTRCDNDGIFVNEEQRLRKGMQMRVVSGLFEGKLVRIDRLSNNGRVEVLMSMIEGGQVRVSMDESSLVAAA